MKAEFNKVNKDAFHCGKQISENENNYIYTATLPDKIKTKDGITHNVLVADIKFRRLSIYDGVFTKEDKENMIKIILQKITESSFDVLEVTHIYIGGGFFIHFWVGSPFVIDIFVQKFVDVK